MYQEKYKQMLEVSVILPTYNEKDNISSLLDDICALNHPQIIEIIVVDDSSPDGTSQIVKRHELFNKKIKLITRLQNPGLVSSINEGINNAKGDVVLWLDADGQMPASLIPKLIDKQNEGCDISMGSRFITGASDERYKNNGFIVLSQKIASSLLCHLLYFIFKLPVIDISSGFIAIKKSVFQEYTLKGDYGEYFLDLIIHAKSRHLIISELPYILGKREFGESKSQKGGYIGMIKIGLNFIKVAFKKRN
jgi:dolichol-phosphate mannosyltransferase